MLKVANVNAVTSSVRHSYTNGNTGAHIPT